MSIGVKSKEESKEQTKQARPDRREIKKSNAHTKFHDLKIMAADIPN